MKTIKYALAPLLCIIALLSLCSCSKPEGDQALIVGTWEAEFDVSDELLSLATGNDASLEDYFDFDGISFTAHFTFFEDGKMEYYFDEESSAVSYEQFVAAFKVGMRSFCDDAYAAQYGSFESFCSQMGTTPDAILSGFLSDISPEKLFAVSKGRYKLDDGKILLSTDEGKEPSDNTYWVYTTLDDSNLCIIEGYTSGVKSDIDSFPMNFTKVK